MMSIVTFLSDFGLNDAYVGCVKGVMLSLEKDIEIVDITHTVNPFSIDQAAYIIFNYYNYYPGGTVHLVVVDPGVGGSRLPLIIKTKKYYFVGPDNGIFSYIISKESYNAYSIKPGKCKKYFPVNASATFHARDIFGPAAALLSKGISPGRLGDPYTKSLHSFEQNVYINKNEIVVKIIYIDWFGNIISGLSKDIFKKVKTGEIREIIIKDLVLSCIKKTYSDVKKGEFLALWGSSGFLEISLNGGNAAEKLDCKMNVDFLKIKLE